MDASPAHIALVWIQKVEPPDNKATGQQAGAKIVLSGEYQLVLETPEQVMDLISAAETS